ncbi:response regulator [Mariprofundus erugo]|uniref:histidine kinase n=1 Tax=Mariprofundus erugo TaxID=2528639 RepID=A0A5R9GW35_9PROT|nr:PAS domain-containing sensor histidine kinase [Mariprofundus erugo]TLS68287.1 response regulator [Mariprofundus erugo]
MPHSAESFDSVFGDRRRLMALVHLASAAALILFVFVHLMRGCCMALTVVEASLALLTLVTWRYIRADGSLVRVEQVLMVAAFVLFSSLVLLKSIDDTGIYWVGGYPFVAYFVQPARTARYWVLMLVVELLVVVGIEGSGWQLTAYSESQLLCLVALVGFYWMLAHIYKSQLELHQRQLGDSYQALSNEQERLKIILDHSPIGIWMVDGDRHIRILNQTWVKWCGLSESEVCQAADYTDLLPESVAVRARELDDACLAQHAVHYSREPFRCADGVMRTLDMIRVGLHDGAGRVVGLIGFAIDITDQLHAQEEQQLLERQLQHAQRLEALGVMAGGIAHDFNNLLTAIQGGIELARLEQGIPPALLESIETMDTAAQAAAGLCRQMLTYSGKGHIAPECLYLRQVIEELRTLFEVSVGKDVRLSFYFEPETSPVYVDKSQISQMLLNLLINASESMPEGRGGEVTISVVHRQLLEPLSCHFTGAIPQPGLYTCLSVEDNGIGMDEETIQRMFDPFFSTKFTGRGLGLSAIAGILKSHGAALQVESKPGKGTRMQVWLPSCEGVTVTAKRPEVEVSRQYSGRVLLVDDDPGVIHVAGRMLGKLGLQCVSAGNGRDAVEIFERDPSFDWVLLDVTMPEMDGAACLQALRHIRPDVYVAMSSGYDADSVLYDSSVQPDDFLTKPYTMQRLREVVKQAADAARPDGA